MCGSLKSDLMAAARLSRRRLSGYEINGEQVPSDTHVLSVYKAGA